MTLSLNQFALEPIAGDIAISSLPVISAIVKSDEATALVPGQAVKLVDVAGGAIIVTATTADTDEPFGFVLRNVKDVDFPASSRVEIATDSAIEFMTAGAAIARGAYLEYDVATNKVITNAGTNPVCGIALDKASADGDLIRVIIRTRATSAQTIGDIAGLADALEDRVQVVEVTATTAEINAGKTLIAGVTGKQITVTDITARVSGNFTTTTSVDVQSSGGTKVSVMAVAALTTGSVLKPGDSNVSRAAGYATALTAGNGVVVANVGSAAAGGTSITYTISYKQS